MASSGSMGGKSPVVESDEPERVNPSRRGRKKSKGVDVPATQKVKRAPQRGMGVAELERLRLLEMGSHFRTPFTSDPAPIEVPAKFPPGFGPTGYDLSLGVGGHGQYLNPYGSAFPPSNLREYLGSRKSKELPSIPSPVYKKMRINGDQDYPLNKSSNGNINKGMVVEHQFFPTTELGSVDANNSVETPSAGIRNDDHTMLFFSDSNSIDLSLKL